MSQRYVYITLNVTKKIVCCTGSSKNKSMDIADNLTLSNLMSRNNTKRNSRNEDNSSNWEKEKEIFELQLTQLQEQLVAAMVQNQQLSIILIFVTN